MRHPAFASGHAAIVTGAASGIGLAAARHFAGLGMAVCMTDIDTQTLEREAAALVAGGADILARPVDVADAAQVAGLRDAAVARWGHVSVLMNNAGRETTGRITDGANAWRAILETNLWGAINGVQAFMPGMVAAGRPACIVNTGSKQGITTPPGNTAYNVSKAGLKVLTEGLAHDLLGTAVTAHLLIPGYTFTGFTRVRTSIKPDGAWTPEQVIEFMMERLGQGDFYILCPDNDTSRAVDERRIRWAADDVILNRPALSRWHPDYAQAFKDFMAQ